MMLCMYLTLCTSLCSCLFPTLLDAFLTFSFLCLLHIAYIHPKKCRSVWNLLTPGGWLVSRHAVTPTRGICGSQHLYQPQAHRCATDLVSYRTKASAVASGQYSLS